MSPPQKRRWILLLVMAVLAFGLLAVPNATASDNISMVQMFEPDEAAPLPYVLHMIAPAKSLDQALRSFVFYEYYYYGFPYFGLSALLLLPLRWLGQISNLPVVMLLLRQLISVLPMLAGLLLLVYLQDGFRTYRSPLLFGLLLIIPGVFHNNTWWHPDGLIFFLVVLTLFFLRRDNLSLRWNFLLAAITCGIATATKLVGVYFFLAVGLSLVLSLVLKRATWKRAIGMGLAFLATMAVSYVAANPFLLSHWARTAYWYILNKQADLLNLGYGIIYDKGLAASWPTVHENYGEAVFLLLALLAAAWGSLRGPNRLLHALILAWFIPVSISVFWFTHFKYQYWLPAVTILISSLVILLPEDWSQLRARQKTAIFRDALILVVLVQGVLFIRSDIPNFVDRVHRADNNPRIQFYDQAVATLKPTRGASLSVYYDYRLYVPDTPGWTTETSYDLLEYNYIQQRNFAVLLLLEQRIRDYLLPSVVGTDPELFKQNQRFYRDADNETLVGYHLLYRNSVGLIYVSDPVYEKYFTSLVKK